MTQFRTRSAHFFGFGVRSSVGAALIAVCVLCMTCSSFFGPEAPSFDGLKLVVLGLGFCDLKHRDEMFLNLF